MAPSPVGQVAGTSLDIATTTTITLPFAVQPGDLIVAKLNRGTASGQTHGGHTIAVSAGAIGTQWRATSSRASTHNTGMVAAFCTAAMPANSTVTITTTSNVAKRGWIIEVYRGCAIQPPEVISPDAATGTADTTSNGTQGSNTTPGITLAAQATPDALVTAAIGVGGSATMTPAVGWTMLTDSRTTSGSADRGVIALMRLVTTAASTNPHVTAATNQSFAAVGMIFAAAPDPEPDTGAATWIDTSGDPHQITSMVWIDATGDPHTVTATRWADSSGDLHIGL